MVMKIGMRKIIYMEVILISMGLLSSIFYGIVRGIVEQNPLLSLAIASPAILVMAYVVWDWKTTSTSTARTEHKTSTVLVSK